MIDFYTFQHFISHILTEAKKKKKRVTTRIEENGIASIALFDIEKYVQCSTVTFFHGLYLFAKL